MKLASRIASCLALFVVMAPIAAHADSFNFSAAGSGFQSSGTFTLIADPTQPGVYDVTAITGEVNGVAITGLLAGSYNASSPTSNQSGVFIFDNLDYATSPELDYNGIGFNIGYAGYQGNFYYTQGSYYFLDSNGVNTQLTSWSTSPTAATPEPASLLLLGTGLAGVAGAVRRRMRA